MGTFIPVPLEGLWLTLVEVTQISHPLPTQGCLCIDCHESHRKKTKQKNKQNMLRWNNMWKKEVCMDWTSQSVLDFQTRRWTSCSHETLWKRVRIRKNTRSPSEITTLKTGRLQSLRHIHRLHNPQNHCKSLWNSDSWASGRHKSHFVHLRYGIQRLCAILRDDILFESEL